MFSLVIAIVSIALVVAVVLAGSYYGGSGISDAAAQADAARLKNEEQQILAAADIFNADKGRYPTDVQELVTEGYLKSIPRGAQVAAAEQLKKGITVAGLLAVAQAYAADDVTLGWHSPATGEPVFETTATVPALTCAKYNQVSRGDDGILKQAFTSQRAQCYGVDGDYRVVINKVGGGTIRLADAIGPSKVLEGNLPAASGTVFWDKLPSGDVKVDTDPDKTPFAKLVVTPVDGDDFGGVNVGQSVTSNPRAVVNQGNIPATGLSLSAPSGFSVATTSCGPTLGPGASCSFAVRFTPPAIGAYSGDVVLASANAGSPSYPVVGQGHQAKLALNPAAATFGTLQTGQTATSAVITASNAGDIPTTGLSITPPSGFSLASNTCGTSIAAGASCTFRIVFEPVQAQAYNTAIAVNSTNAGNQAVTVSGTAQAPSATLTNLDFGDQAGGTSSQQSVTLANTGIGPLTLTAPSAASVSGADFSFVSSTCGTNLAVGQSCTVTVRYTANGAQAATGSVTLATGAGTKTATLSGQGRIAVFSLNPTSVAFGNVQVGDSKTSAAITLTNTGNAAATGVGFAPLNDFSVVGSTCPSTLAAGASCTFSVKLSASKVGAYSGSGLAVMADNTGAALSTSGTGRNPSATLTGSVPFGSVAVGSSSDQVATLTNTGVGPLSVSAQGVTGADFSLVSTTCGSSLAAGANCAITARYTASGIGAASGTLSVSTAAGTKTSALTGSGLGSVATLTTPANATLADWYQTGTATLAVNYRNDGNAPLTLQSPSLSSPLSVTANSCTDVAPGATCGINVSLTRNANTGGSSSQAFVAQGAGVAPGQATVNWAIYSRIPSWSASSHDFGSVTVGSSVSKSFVVTNTGSVAADWSGAGALPLPAGFTSNLTACSNVAPNGNCTVTITFTPTAAQAYSAPGLVLNPASFSVNTLSLSGSGLAVVGEVSYTTEGTYSWTVPAGVYNVSFVAIGGGGMGSYGASGGTRVGGGGGALVYRNNLGVTPGQVLTVQVGGSGNGSSPGGTSSFAGATAYGGGSGYSGSGAGQPAGTYTAGFAGGNASTVGSWDNQLGGCSGGYTANGCNGGGYTGGQGSDLFGSNTKAQFGFGGSSSAYGWGTTAGSGAVRIIWGNNRTFPSNAN